MRRLNHSQRKIIRRALLIPLALLFMLEAWLWDITGACIQRLIRLLPLDTIKHRVATFIAAQSPIRTLLLFIIPALVLLPFKFIALWLLAHGFFIGGMSMVVLAKLAGLGVSSYLFTQCKPKLLQLRWVRWLYEHCLVWREKAAKMVRPYTTFIRRFRQRFFGGKNIFSRLRGRMHKSRARGNS